ncbi:MAG: hypothetical protein FD189_483 [Elusimicrobia bacterium]|nr:MAG: hypothetical protein FD154_1759 [Elusimicrobiota bacterium]KAF0157469.1 MAG: hypothetical protein FD189_483 [Elusimicrobiota bacterium]
MSVFPHLFYFNFRRILSLARVHILMLLMLVVMAFFFGHVSGASPDPAHMGAVVSMFCGNFLVFNSLMMVFMISENVFFMEKSGRIMESVFSAPVGHGVVALSKTAALSLTAWAYPVLVLGAVLAVYGSGVLAAVSVPHLVLIVAVLPVLLFAVTLMTGLFLLLARDIRVKNIVTSAVLFAVMGLSKKVMAVSKTAGFLPIVYAYAAVAVLFLLLAAVMYKTVYTKAAVLSTSY